MLVLPLKYSTFETVPSASAALAVSEMLAGAVNDALLAGEDIDTVGATLPVGDPSRSSAGRANRPLATRILPGHEAMSQN